MAISRVSDRVGQVLGGRYRLLGPIGAGASATVYLADDTSLRRRVAVKVLHAALADDAAFLKRFEAEARAAAALDHPNVMGVFDWGEGDVPYLVTQLLSGGSLRALLDSGARLDVAQARQVGYEAARGLEYAHRKGLVHRDIKPANLIFDGEGRLRIADFGLARALAEAAWTEPMDAVLGTARYASPEQAQALGLDGRSDVYSLALVLLEAVTGEVPFTADTTLGTLMARVDQPLPVPTELGPLGPIVAAAGHPDPEQRPDAATFITLLMGAGDLGPVAPLPVAGTATIDPDAFEPREPTTLYVSERSLRADLDPEIMGAPPGTTTNGLTIVHEGDQPATVKIDRPASAADPQPTRADRRQARKQAKADKSKASAGGSGGGDDPPPPQVRTLEPAPKERHVGRLLAVLAVVVVLLGAGAFATWWFAVRTPTVTLDSYVGQPVDAVAIELARNDLIVDPTEVYDEAAEAGTVIGQDPPPRTVLSEGDTVRLTVSLGPPPVALPDPGGNGLSQVTEEFAALGLQIGEVRREYDENWDPDIVLGLAPGTPAELPKGSTVGLIVSNGPVPRTVPSDLEGATSETASAALRAIGLRPSVTERHDDTVEKGRVISTNPGQGATVPRDSTVTVVVSAGPPVSTIPASIVGMSVTEATQALANLNLTVSGVQGSPANNVTGSTPAVGQSVRHGTAVALVTG